MSHTPPYDLQEADLYRAGQLAPPGRYRRVGAPSSRIVILENIDFLPASCDGHVAEYYRISEEPAHRPFVGAMAAASEQAVDQSA